MSYLELNRQWVSERRRIVRRVPRAPLASAAVRRIGKLSAAAIRAVARPRPPGRPRPPAAGRVWDAGGRAGPRPAGAGSRGLALSRSIYSRALYDTGEHVLSGEVATPLFDGAAVVLQVNGVPFTYAELIAMGDLYASDEDLRRAPAAELGRLRALIQKTRRHYENRILRTGPGGDNTGDAEWQGATGGRYLALAEDNFAHFAPSNGDLIPGFASARPNHRAEWERYHAAAIARARGGSTNEDLLDALVTNAFGDHFLTDAFAAGHLFNKDDISQVFRSRVLNGASINPAGDRFFERVANQAFTGDLASEFGRHETVEWKGVVFRPNINSAGRFKALLIGIMEREPEILGKTVIAKAVHDRLNSFSGGVPVENARGDTWNLTGDGSLDRRNLDLMRQAVSQSIGNVHDAVSSATPVADYHRRVWAYVPRPTAAALPVVRGLIDTLSDPARTELVDATAALITANWRALLAELVRRRILKRA